MKKQIKHLVLAMCICVFAFVITGCGAAVTTGVRITSSTRANCTISVGYDDEMLSALAEFSGTTKAALIKEMKKSGAKYATKKIDGVTYNMFYMTVKNAKLCEIEEMLTESGYTNVCLTGSYFYATLDTRGSSAGSSASTSTGSIDMTDSMSFYMSTRITFKSKVNTTNGKLSKDGKTVSWVVKKAGKKNAFYASTNKATKTTTINSVRNGKTYKAGKKLTVSYSRNLVRMKLDGRIVKPGTAVRKKGTHTVMIWSRNGRIQKITFKIK